MQGVFIVEEETKQKPQANFVPVTTGITGATDIEVLTGLTEGEEIVTGPFKTMRTLKGGALVKRDDAKPTPTGNASTN